MSSAVNHIGKRWSVPAVRLPKEEMSSSNKSPSKISGRDSFVVTVRLLEDEKFLKVVVSPHATGKWLLDEVCKKHDVLDEVEYFGLRYVSCEILSTPTKHWMDNTKTVRSQLKNTNPLQASFRIKHYPADPFSEFKVEKCKYLLFHQLHRDFLSGRLIAPNDDLFKMAALFVEVTLGDASILEAQFGATHPNATSDAPNYLSDYRILHNQTRRGELEVIHEHRKLEGLLPGEAAAEVIRIATALESYGLEPFKVQAKHQGTRPVHIGLTHQGIAEFCGSKRMRLYTWNQIEQLFYSGKHLIIVQNKAIQKGQKPEGLTTDFKCESKAIASSLWTWALERKLFFTLEKSTVAKPVKSKYGLFSRRHTFNFTGRCQSEVMSKSPIASTLPNSYRSRHKMNDSHSEVHSLKSQTLDRSKATSSESRLASNTDGAITPASLRNCYIASLEKCDENSESLEISDSGVLMDSPPKPPHLTLAPFFESMPNRKSTTLPRTRGVSENTSNYSLMTEFQSVETGIQAPTKKDYPLPEENSSESAESSPKKEASPIKQFVSRSNTADHSTENCIEAKTETDVSTDPVTYQAEGNPSSTDTFDAKPQRNLWRTILLPGSFLLSMVCLGAALIIEMDVQAPILNSIRGSSTFVNWELYVYRPMRSAITGLFPQ